MSRSLALLTALLVACAPVREPEAYDDWYGPMGELDEDVEEPVQYTDAGYTYPEQGPSVGGLADLAEDFTRKYAPEDLPPDASCGDWVTTSDLPREMWAMVTLHPRYYFKTDGCDSQVDEGDSEEKYYGSFFIEDSTGGIFVLGDSKVAHFDMGDRVKIRIRGIQRSFGLNMVVAHDIVEVDRGPYAIHYTPAPALDFSEYPDETWLGKTVRAEGVVTTDPDTFGEFSILADNGSTYLVALDSELNRRKVHYPIGSRIRATGPVQRAFGDKIIIMRKGQIEVLSTP
ncbi:MAG: hypothetical protein H6737_20785 [Alphaproteobacteria bacterium]|nr:hypothetical protein [Alphaproteobacteria bacterium]